MEIVNSRLRTASNNCFNFEINVNFLFKFELFSFGSKSYLAKQNWETSKNSAKAI